MSRTRKDIEYNRLPDEVESDMAGGNVASSFNATNQGQLGEGYTDRRVKNVLAGSTGTDAANVSQLHAEGHDIDSHDTTTTGAQLNQLVDGTDADHLHIHTAGNVIVTPTQWLGTWNSDDALVEPNQTPAKTGNTQVTAVKYPGGVYHFFGQAWVMNSPGSDSMTFSTHPLPPVGQTNIISVVMSYDFDDAFQTWVLTVTNDSGHVPVWPSLISGYYYSSCKPIDPTSFRASCHHQLGTNGADGNYLVPHQFFAIGTGAA